MEPRKYKKEKIDHNIYTKTKNEKKEDNYSLRVGYWITMTHHLYTILTSNEPFFHLNNANTLTSFVQQFFFFQSKEVIN